MALENFRVWCPVRGEDRGTAMLCRAQFRQKAVEAYHERCNNDDWAEEMVLHVVDAQGRETVWRSRAELVPMYDARLIYEVKEGQCDRLS